MDARNRTLRPSFRNSENLKRLAGEMAEEMVVGMTPIPLGAVPEASQPTQPQGPTAAAENAAAQHEEKLRRRHDHAEERYNAAFDELQSSKDELDKFETESYAAEWSGDAADTVERVAPVVEITDDMTPAARAAAELVGGAARLVER